MRNHQYKGLSPHPTMREMSLLVLLTKGHTIETAAPRLGISPHTARTHLARLRQKLGALTTMHAIALAYERRLLPLRGTPQRGDNRG